MPHLGPDDYDEETPEDIERRRLHALGTFEHICQECGYTKWAVGKKPTKKNPSAARAICVTCPKCKSEDSFCPRGA
jgi:hypothetical protein